MARITVEDCIDKFQSRFELVLIASQRARKLYSGESPKIDRDNDKNTVIALREIANLSFSVEEMKENLIQEYETVTLQEEEDENLEFESAENENENKQLDSENSSKQIEEEIKQFTTSEESEIESQYNIESPSESSEENLSLENEESESPSESSEENLSLENEESESSS